MKVYVLKSWDTGNKDPKVIVCKSKIIAEIMRKQLARAGWKCADIEETKVIESVSG